jgi:hypothetical protein
MQSFDSPAANDIPDIRAGNPPERECRAGDRFGLDQQYDEGALSAIN